MKAAILRQTIRKQDSKVFRQILGSSVTLKIDKVCFLFWNDQYLYSSDFLKLFIDDFDKTQNNHLHVIIHLSAVSDSEWQRPSDLRDFLLQSSDEEDAGCFELSDSQLDSEAEVMAYFYNNPAISPQQPDHISQRYSFRVHLHAILSNIAVT